MLPLSSPIMDNALDDWLMGEAWNCKAPEHRSSSDRRQERPTPSNSYAATDSLGAETDRLVLNASTEYRWPRALPPRQLHGYNGDKAVHMLLRVVVNMATIGVLVYAIIALASFQKVPVDYDSCLAATASWFESRFFINVVVREDLSFTQAKLLDLAWDTFIGQGLRFFHAWWLYRVATHIVTYCLETSGLTYDFLLALLFRTDSFSSLTAALRMTSGKNWTNCRLYCAWLTFAIGYILVFPTIWTASTGYASPSITAYSLSGKTYVPIKSEDLTLCWVTDDARLSGFLGSVVLGPSFSSAYDFDENEVPGPGTPWKLPTNSSDFNDIFYYAKTKHGIQNYFHSFDNTSNPIDSFIELPTNHVVNTTLNWTRSAAHIVEERDGLFFYDNSARDVWNAPRLLQVLIGSQFSRTSPSYQEAMFYLNRSGWADGQLNGTRSLGPGIVPYNSTLVLENETLFLPAPFLSFGVGDFDCSWWNSSTGECPCYQGKPLEADWAISNQYSCIGTSGYIWGFSSFILTVAVALEAIWIIGCWVARWRTTVGSNLIELNRRNIGTVRHILDLAETINRDLGPNTSVYTDDELQEALLKCPPVGYEVESKDGLKHIGLVTVHRGSRWKKKIDINFDDTYR
ncbi:hypothetical protein F5Y10DRAFT_38560 [Nemania abortiva]|nr:hypothetical protein F5Y10DRAFT_38560 [Nemania abortiva]